MTAQAIQTPGCNVCGAARTVRLIVPNGKEVWMCPIHDVVLVPNVGLMTVRDPPPPSPPSDREVA